MTPAARLAAAIGVLDSVLAGVPAEQALTNWARASRFAGSGDRAAVRDHVFDVLRARDALAVLGAADAAVPGGPTAEPQEGAPAPEGAAQGATAAPGVLDGMSGRSLILGLLRQQGVDPAPLFTGIGHAPAPLDAAEAALVARPLPAPEALAPCVWPAWLRPQLAADLGQAFAPVSALMAARAPVFLRVNGARTTVEAAQAELAADGVATRPHPLATCALEVTSGARKVQSSAAYLAGRVEVQDVASQAVAQQVPLGAGMRVLDYCAGGGGKTLALAARMPEAQFTAHDISAARMRDLPARAARAGARITLARPGAPGGPFDLVLVDAPCSGSGTWRRTPDAKWRLTAEALERIIALQREILLQACGLVAPGGHLVYMTCSLLATENSRQQVWFTAQTGWPCIESRCLTPLDGGDGFFMARFTRPQEKAIRP